jgi:hypothetical protein
MTSILFSILIVVSSVSFAQPIVINIGNEKPKGSWSCSVKAFTESYEALGSTKTEATYKVQKKCKKKNHEMHCKDVICEGDEEESRTGWVCKVSAFTDDYETYALGKTEATYKVSKKCQKDHDEMHCRDVKCESAE